MKRFLSAFVCFAVSCILFFSGCSENGGGGSGNSNSSLVGTWESGGGITIVMQSNGRGTIKYCVSCPEYGFSYNLNNGYIAIIPDDESEEPFFISYNGGNTLEFEGVTLNKNVSGGENNGGGNNGGSSGSLVNGNNDAWIAYYDNEAFGYIFKSNGDFLYVNIYYGKFCVGDIGYKWSVSGNRLTLKTGYYEISYTYTVSGNSLTLQTSDTKMTLSKISGITFDCDYDDFY